MAVSQEAPYFCSGTLCHPTLQPEGNGFCYRDARDCVIYSGYEIPTKHCASASCQAVPIDQTKQDPNDVCTASQHTCLYASKHKHFNWYHPSSQVTIQQKNF